jgi:DNA mismatch repair protein MutS2
MNIDSKLISDLGFDVIQNWLTEHCHCIENKDYFSNLSPILNQQNLKQSQDQTEELLSSFIRKDSPPSQIIPNINTWIESLSISGSQLNENQFNELYQVLEFGNTLKAFCKQSDFPLWSEIVKQIQVIPEGKSKIKDIFDDSFTLRDDASSQLKQLHKSLQKAQSRIHSRMNEIFSKAKDSGWLQGDKIAFQNGRSVIPVQSTHKRKINGIIQGQSATGQTAFIEPLEIIELNNEISETQFAIIEEQKRILRELTAFFKPYSSDIQSNYFVILNFDIHRTIALQANILKASKPNLTNQNIVHIEQGKNPLFTLAEKKVIPLNLNLSKDTVLLISGPNAGGKTVVLKTIGLFVLMAQCGLFVPAKKVSLPIFNAIVADIGDRQSIEDDLSTFSAHIYNLANILKDANSKTLVLLDELGTGTEPDAGAAISQAILETLLIKKSFVFATTHLGALKIWAHDQKGVVNGGMVFNSKKLAPSYELNMGTPGSSYAIEISQRMGLDGNIIDRAKELIGDNSVKLETILNQLETERNEVILLKGQIKDRETSINLKEDHINRLQVQVKKEHKHAKIDAAKEAQKLVHEARKQIETLVSNIKSKNADTESIRNAHSTIEKTLKNLEIESKPVQTNTFAPLNIQEANHGVKVFIPHLDSEGVIIYPPDKKQKVTVEINGVKFKLKLNELTIADKSTKEESKFTGELVYSRPESMQIDLRGFRVDNALIEVEQFLDKALMSGMQMVQILHGKGTGALMEAIQTYLKSQSFVNKYYFAKPEHGGAGITVVELS